MAMTMSMTNRSNNNTGRMKKRQSSSSSAAVAVDQKMMVAAAAFAFCSLLSCGTVAFAFTTTTAPFRYSQHVQVPQQQQNALGFSRPTTTSTTTTKFWPSSRPQSQSYPLTAASNSNEEEDEDDKLFDFKTTIALVGGQSLLIGAAALAAKVVGTPNYGLGPNIDFGLVAIGKGILWSLPLGGLAVVLDVVEDKFPALQEVTKATQSSVLSLLGGTFKPLLGLLTALALGLAAGLGEEMLFRGVLQFELGSKLGSDAIAVGVASIIFGALHAVTPLYAFLAALASVYFGWLYLVTGNLAIPIVTHAFYDWAALFYAHWTVANLSETEKTSLLEWRFGGSGSDEIES